METSGILEIRLVENSRKYWNFIRKLRNDTAIQKGFVEQVQITPAQQNKYMQKYNSNYYICLNGENEPIGYIGEIGRDIRLAVVQEYQKKGVGKFMINSFMKLKPKSNAKVKLDNIASKRLFESCNFTMISKDDKFYYFIKHDI
jgi:RimJ/RimL family protein N-acetyltransferase